MAHDLQTATPFFLLSHRGPEKGLPGYRYVIVDAWRTYLRDVRAHVEVLRSMGIDELVLPEPSSFPQFKPGRPPADVKRVERTAQGRPPTSSTRPAAPAQAEPQIQPSRRILPPPPPLPGREAAAAPAPVSPRTAAKGAAKSADSLEAIQAELGNCTRCRLSEKRRSIIFGVGNPNADLMFIGEGPGEEEDRQGEPFVGEAAQMLTKLIENGMGLRKSDVYIANVVKCRPPNARVPFIDETETCFPFLRRQIEVIRPKVIVALGNSAAQTLLGVSIRISQLRGNFYRYGDNVRVMPTFHPDYLSRNPHEKVKTWADIKQVMAALGLKA